MISLEDLYACMPRLRESTHRITSPPTDEYNCVAWVERDLRRWWQPEFYWPQGVPRPLGEDDLDCYIALFEELGFEVTEDADPEPGFLKIAIFSVGAQFQHVAKQLRSGAWSSKIGEAHDLRHDELDALADSGLWEGASPTFFMRRLDDGTDPFEIEESGLLLR